MFVNNTWVPEQIGTPDMKYHIHWEYVYSTEFLYRTAAQDEYYDSFDAAKTRIAELLFDWNDHHFSTRIWWFDGDYTGEPYRYFETTAPDRG